MKVEGFGLDPLFWINDPRVALTVKSVIFSCGGHRSAIITGPGKSLSLSEVDFVACSRSGGDSAVTAQNGVPLNIKNGAFKGAGGGTYTSIFMVDTPTSTGTLLSATGTQFSGNLPGEADILIRKTTPNKLKAAFKNCKFSDNDAQVGTCSVLSRRNDVARSPAGPVPGKPLTLDFGGSVFSAGAVQQGPMGELSQCLPWWRLATPCPV